MLAIIAIALVRDVLGLLALVALFAIAVNKSERTTPRWLRRRGYPPPLYLETKEGRQRLKQLMRDRARQNPDDEAPGQQHRCVRNNADPARRLRDSLA